METLEKEFDDFNYDGENLLVYDNTEISWGSDNEKDYNDYYKKIVGYKEEDKNFTITIDCDHSGFEYWKNNGNYITIVIQLKKKLKDFNQDEINELKKKYHKTYNFVLDSIKIYDTEDLIKMGII